MSADPLVERCTATSKQTGVRCEKRVRGGGVCYWHGGASPNVRAKREQRVIVAEAAQSGTVVEDRSPAAVILATMTDADAVLQKIKAQFADAGAVDPALFGALGEWMDRVARIARVALDGGLGDEHSEQEARREAGRTLDLLHFAVFRVVRSMAPTPEQAAHAWTEWWAALADAASPAGLNAPKGWTPTTGFPDAVGPRTTSKEFL